MAATSTPVAVNVVLVNIVPVAVNVVPVAASSTYSCLTSSLQRRMTGLQPLLRPLPLQLLLMRQWFSWSLYRARRKADCRQRLSLWCSKMAEAVMEPGTGSQGLERPKVRTLVPRPLELVARTAARSRVVARSPDSVSVLLAAPDSGTMMVSRSDFA